jgi:hypothetical protein
VQINAKANLILGKYGHNWLLFLEKKNIQKTEEENLREINLLDSRNSFGLSL